jgi:tetratricopeptide (TPR) repeat protein
MKRFIYAALWVSLGGLVGCATTPPAVPLTGDIFRDAPAAIEKGPPRDKLLWQYRLALAEMRRGHFDAAKPLLDDALLTLGGLYGKDSEARKSRRLFQQEAKKTFIGEPYERSMAYFYRGILYWRDGERDNARACFRSAQFEDSDNENGEYKNDYVLLDYLEGLATAKLGGDGSDAFQRAEKNARGAKPPPYDRQMNTLIFLDFGPGPVKYGGGEYGEQLRFRTQTSPVQSVQLRVDGKIAKIQSADDLNFQATTRGGRLMDHVLANKAVFKSTTSAVGDAALITGAVLATDKDHNDVGAALMIAGLFSKVVSAATTPQADTRAWEALPQFLALGQFRLSPGEYTLAVDFLDASGAARANFSKQINFTVPEDRDAVVYVSDQSTTPQIQ